MDLFKGNSILSNGSSKQNKQNIACDSCRTKKRKCDGEFPCDACIRGENGGSDCSFNATSAHNIPITVSPDNERPRISKQPEQNTRRQTSTLSSLDREFLRMANSSHRIDESPIEQRGRPNEMQDLRPATFKEPPSQTRSVREESEVGSLRSQREPTNFMSTRNGHSRQVSNNSSRDNPDIELILTLEKQLKTERSNTMQLLEEQIELGERLRVVMKLAKDSAEKAEKLSDLIQSYRNDESNGIEHSSGRPELFSPIVSDSRVEKRILDSDKMHHYKDNIPKRQAYSLQIDPSITLRTNPSIPEQRLPSRTSYPPQNTPNTIRIQDSSTKNSLSRVRAVLINQFQRKTRTVLLYPGQNPELKSSVFISSLDGIIQGWDIETRQSMLRISNLEWMPKQNWVEDMQWVSEDTIAVCANKTETPGSQVALLNVRKDRNKIFQCKSTYLDVVPHSKSIF
jgi:hypothetical protein